MNLMFSMTVYDEDTEINKNVDVHGNNVEYLGDALELFLSFLQGCGYTYVKQIIAVNDNDQETVTVL